MSSQQMYLQIRSNNEIDPAAMRLMGASLSRGDADKIGFFGTGNKYALAVFMRADLDVLIYSGTKRIAVNKTPCRFGDQVFDVINIDGMETSITTAMGPSWAMWQAIREVYSNALDQGGASIDLVHEPEPEAGRTCYCIQANSEVLSIFENFNLYFSSKRTPIYQSGNLAIYEGGTGTVYRKGIRCVAVEQYRSHYDYEVGDIDLTEERAAKYGFEVLAQIRRAVLESSDAAIIDRFMRADEGTIEHMASREHLDYNMPTPSQAFRQWAKSTLLSTPAYARVMTERETLEAVFLDTNMMAWLIKTLGSAALRLPARLGGSGPYETLEPTAEQAAMIADCVSTMDRNGLQNPYSIRVVDFFADETLGQALPEERAILLSMRVFSKGYTFVLATILEEWLHLKHRVHDETRAMQDAMFEEFASVLMRNVRQPAQEAA